MSPRQANPDTRTMLIDLGAHLVARHGLAALSTRRIAKAAGTSTMAVYTHFGGMSGLIREMVREGFVRLERSLALVERTDDPVADMAVLGRAYRHNALCNPHLHKVMFGDTSLGGYAMSEEERQHGRYTLEHIVDCAARCLERGRFQVADAAMVAHQMWIATHGLVNLELGQYFVDPYDAESCFEAQLIGLMVGVGDKVDLARQSIEDSSTRFESLIAEKAFESGR